MAYFQRALLLFCVAAVTVFHNRLVEASTAGEAAKTPSSAKENVASTEMGAHDYMLRLYHELARNGKVLNRGAVKGNQVHGFIDNDGSSDRIFKFNISIPRQQHIRFVELAIHKLPSTQPQTSQNFTITINIIDIWNSSLLATQKVTMGTTGWISFPLRKSTIRRWNRYPHRNAGISVQVSDMPSSVQFSTRHTNATFEPILVVHCKDPESFHPFQQNSHHAHRSGRSVHSGFAGKCQIHNLTIYFKDLGWDKWFIAPKMYSANYCGGTCLDRYNTQMMSNHALVQLLVHEKEPGRAHAPCCVPNNMSALSVLYFGGPGKSTYVLKTVDDFAVQSCACL